MIEIHKSSSIKYVRLIERGYAPHIFQIFYHTILCMYLRRGGLKIVILLRGVGSKKMKTYFMDNPRGT